MSGSRIFLRRTPTSSRWWAPHGDGVDTTSVTSAGVFPAFPFGAIGWENAPDFEEVEPFAVLDREILSLRRYVRGVLRDFREFLATASEKARLLEETQRFLVIQAWTDPVLEARLIEQWIDVAAELSQPIGLPECAALPEPDELRAALGKPGLGSAAALPERCGKVFGSFEFLGPASGWAVCQGWEEPILSLRVVPGDDFVAELEAALASLGGAR